MEEFRHAAKVIKESEAVFITAGAGIGVDSGLPDFRGNEGFWKAYPPIARLGISFEEMANPMWFQRDSKLAWAFYGHRLNLYRKTIPHEGFCRLLEIAREKEGGYFVFTSNVDGQFQKAGYDKDLIEECHGSIHYLQCTDPCSGAIWDATTITVEVDDSSFKARDPLPRCPNCGRVARPNILMFGDWTWVADRSRLQARRLDAWLDAVRQQVRRLVVIELGAGKAVPTVRHQSERTIRSHNGILIRINPRDYDVPGTRHVSLPVGSEEGILGICTELGVL